MTNRGQLLLLDGGLKGDSMVLTGTDRAAVGATSLTWKPVFDILFRPHAQSRKGATR